MAVVLIRAAQQYLGLSSDTKPAAAVPGSRFLETDTGRVSLSDGSAWNYIRESS